MLKIITVMIIKCVLSDLPQHEMHFLSNGFLFHINGSGKDFIVFIQWDCTACILAILFNF